MDFELRIIQGCPNSGPALQLFREALAAEGRDAGPLTVREVVTENEVQDLRFHGSPSFIIDGKDLFRSNAAPALTCRVYPRQQGLSGQPDLELRQAIRGVRPRTRLRT